jgi:DNA-directed RNA polymerase sigma subunit (sigma70/sigma32)
MRHLTTYTPLPYRKRMRTKNLSRYRRIWHLRVNKGKTFQQIADELEVSRQRVFQIYQRAYKRFKFGDPNFIVKQRAI